MPKYLPKLLHHMRSKRCQECQYCLNGFFHRCMVVFHVHIFVGFVYKLHSCAYCCIEVEASLNIVRNLLYCRVYVVSHFFFHRTVNRPSLRLDVFEQIMSKPPYSVEESERAFHSGIAPLEVFLRRGCKKYEKPCCVRPVFGYYLLGAYYITF